MTIIAQMQGVREHAEGGCVTLGIDQPTGRLVVVAFNEGGMNQTAVDLLDLLAWVRTGAIPEEKISSAYGDDLATNPTSDN